MSRGWSGRYQVQSGFSCSRRSLHHRVRDRGQRQPQRWLWSWEGWGGGSVPDQMERLVIHPQHVGERGVLAAAESEGPEKARKLQEKRGGDQAMVGFTSCSDLALGESFLARGWRSHDWKWLISSYKVGFMCILVSLCLLRNIPHTEMMSVVRMAVKWRGQGMKSTLLPLPRLKNWESWWQINGAQTHLAQEVLWGLAALLTLVNYELLRVQVFASVYVQLPQEV